MFATILGLIPAYIAHRKGRSFGLWWIYGALLLTVVLFAALLCIPSLTIMDGIGTRAPAVGVAAEHVGH